MMTPRQKRFAFVLVGLAALGLAATLVVKALDDSVAYFFSPSDVVAGKAPKERAFRMGGMVVDGSLEREDDGLTVHFKVTDLAATVPVTFTGILPDLFTEGQGMVGQGRMRDDGVFMAADVLAKHDETYMPPEVAEALEKGKQSRGAMPRSM